MPDQPQYAVSVPDKISTDLLLLWHFQHEKPPHGTLGWIDWRLKGRISQLMKDRWQNQALFENAMLFLRNNQIGAVRLVMVTIPARPEITASIGNAVSRHALSLITRIRPTSVQIAIDPWVAHLDAVEGLKLQLVQTLSNLLVSTTYYADPVLDLGSSTPYES